MKEDLFIHLTTKFLEGNATPHEKEILSGWLKQDPNAEDIFYLLVSKRENENPQYLPEMDSKIVAYEEFLKGGRRISQNRNYHETQVYSRPIHHRWWLAASIIFFISASLFFLNDSMFYKTYSAESGMIKSFTLQDGSKVTLNANSSVKVHRSLLGRENREVWINGEAFFEVMKKGDGANFIVHTNNFDVEVLGTKFNVNDRRGKTEVVLSEGKVKLVTKDQKPLIMHPGEQVSLSTAQEDFERHIVKTGKYEAWRNNRLVFENTPLSEVGQIILDYYGIKVVVSDSLLATRQFTGTLPNNDLDVILLALSTAYKIEIERSEDQITLKHHRTK